MSHLNKIFAVWDDNAEAMSSDIGETGVTVRQWRNRGKIHSDHWPKIIKAAWEQRGKVLRFEDFLPPEMVAELPRHSSPEHCDHVQNACVIESAAQGADSRRPFSLGAGSPATSSQTTVPQSTSGRFPSERVSRNSRSSSDAEGGDA